MLEPFQILIVGRSNILRTAAGMLTDSDRFTVAHVADADAPPSVTTPACVLTDPVNAPVALRRYRGKAPVVVCGRALELNAVTSLMRVGAADYLEWPVHDAELGQALRRAAQAGSAAHT